MSVKPQIMRERCHAITTRRGLDRRCMHTTLRGRFCWQHLKEHEGLRIMKSELPDANMGLFTTKDIPKGAIIAQYTGELVVSHDPEFHNEYSLQIKSRPPTYIDSRKTNTGPARYANDARDSDNNSILSYNKVTKKAYLRALRPIHAGDEILTSYGDEYWHSASIPNIKKMRRASNYPRVHAVRQVAEEDDGRDYDMEPEPESKEKEKEMEDEPWDNSPDLPEWTPVKRKPSKPNRQSIGFKRMVRTYNEEDDRLHVINLLFKSKQVAASLGVAVPKGKDLELETPEESIKAFPEGPGTVVDYQKKIEKAVLREEHALVAYMKIPKADVRKLIAAMVAKRKP